MDPDPGHEQEQFSNYFSYFLKTFLCNILMNQSEIKKFLIISLFFHQFRFEIKNIFFRSFCHLNFTRKLLIVS